MLTVNTGYALQSVDTRQATTYVLLLPDIGIYYSTERIQGLVTYPLMDGRPSLASTQVNPISASASLGSVGFALLDQSQAITTLRRENGCLIGQSAVLYQGFRDLVWSQYVKIFPGVLRKFERNNPLLWACEIVDKFSRLDAVVLRPGDIASEPWTGNNKTFDGGTITLADFDEDEIYDAVVFIGDPVTLLLKILLSDGSSDGSQGGYNTLPAWAGIGLTTEDVDVAFCEAERDKVLCVPMRFVFTDAVTVRQFMQDEICKALGGYPLLSASGKIRVHYPSMPVSTDDLPLIDRKAIIGKPSASDAQDYHITHIRYELGDTKFQLGKDGDDGPIIVLNRVSQQWLDGLYHDAGPRAITIRSRGLQPDLGGVSNADAAMDALFARYGDPPVKVKFSTLFSQHRIEAGDGAKFQHIHYPDIDGRGAGSVRLLDLLSVKPAISKVEFEGIDLTAPLTAGQSAIIAPTGTPVWTDADDTERRYGFLSDDDTETLSDGTPSMIWG